MLSVLTLLSAVVPFAPILAKDCFMHKVVGSGREF